LLIGAGFIGEMNFLTARVIAVREHAVEFRTGASTVTVSCAGKPIAPR